MIFFRKVPFFFKNYLLLSSGALMTLGLFRNWIAILTSFSSEDGLLMLLDSIFFIWFPGKINLILSCSSSLGHDEFPKSVKLLSEQDIPPGFWSVEIKKIDRKQEIKYLWKNLRFCWKEKKGTGKVSIEVFRI